MGRRAGGAPLGHVGLAGNKPDLPDRHLLDFDLGGARNAQNKLVSRSRRFLYRGQGRTPIAISIRHNGLGAADQAAISSLEGDRHRTATMGTRVSPDSDRYPSLQNHTISKDLRADSQALGRNLIGLRLHSGGAQT